MKENDDLLKEKKKKNHKFDIKISSPNLFFFFFSSWPLETEVGSWNIVGAWPGGDVFGASLLGWCKCSSGVGARRSSTMASLWWEGDKNQVGIKP